MYAVVAISTNGMIGNEGKMPWPFHKEDMLRFKELTEKSIVVMGRKTWESLGDKAPLPDRINVIISSQDFREFPGANLVTTDRPLSKVTDTLERRFPEHDIAIIGGSSLYEYFIPLCDHVYVTRMHEEYEGDVTLDLDVLLDGFELWETEVPATGDCTFQRYDKIT